jgi:hypothetical protein
MVGSDREAKKEERGGGGGDMKGGCDQVGGQARVFGGF